MEKFYTIIRLKENKLLENQRKLHSKDIELQQQKEEVRKIEKEIKELKLTEVNAQHPEIYSIIDNLKTIWIKKESKMQAIISERNIILSEMMMVKQEIKSIEMLIEKKKIELKELMLKKEQETLDELNSIM